MTALERSPGRVREAVLTSLAAAAERFPDMAPVSFDATRLGLSGGEAALATAIHRTVLERWITLEYLLDRYLTQPCRHIEPGLRAILLSGAAQLLFLPRVGRHAAVNEAVELAKRRVRPKAGALVNVVLRRIAELVKAHHPDQPWQPGVDRLPFEGGCVELALACLPVPERFIRHLSVATSHPVALIGRWRERYGEDEALRLCLQSLRKPPTVVAVEEGFDVGVFPAGAEAIALHEDAGFIVWRGDHRALRSFLAEHPARRVQDPAAAAAVEATRGFESATILDYCAGRGTKARQLAAAHFGAHIWATDTNERRFKDLAAGVGGHERVSVVPGGELPDRLPKRGVDLLVLDVPCTNTGVLARRLEARYRFTRRTVESLVKLQGEIVNRAWAFVRPGGQVLYTTCSIDDRENERRVQTMLVKRGGRLVAERLTLPGGEGMTYRDGGYWAVVKIP